MSEYREIVNLSALLSSQNGSVASLKQLTSLLKGHEKPVIFLGAGASVDSGVLTTKKLTEHIISFGYCTEHHKDDPLNTVINKHDYNLWLKGKYSCYEENSDRSEIYPVAIEYLFNDREERKKFFKKHFCADHICPSPGYFVLAELIRQSNIDTILTTNLDVCLSRTFESINNFPEVREYSEELEFENAKVGEVEDGIPKVLYLHGSIEHFSDKQTRKEVQSLEKSIVDYVLPILQDNPVIVIGYQGLESSIMNYLFMNHKFMGNDPSNWFPKGIYWCARKKEGELKFSKGVEKLASKIGENFHPISITNFDDVMVDKICPALNLSPNFGYSN